MFALFLTSSNIFFRILLDISGGCLTCLIFSIIWNQLRSAYHLRHVPGPTAASRLWGSEWDMHKALPGQRYLEWKTRYGNVFKIKGILGVCRPSCIMRLFFVMFMQRNHLAISDLRAVKFILEEHVFDFPKPQGVREWFRLLVGEGLLVVEGAYGCSALVGFGPRLTGSQARLLMLINDALLLLHLRELMISPSRALLSDSGNSSQQAVRPLLATFYGIATKVCVKHA